YNVKLNITKLYEKYLSLDIPNPFLLNDIDNRLKTAYHAEEADLRYHEGLRSDPHADFETAIKAYSFTDERGIQELLKLNPEEYLESYKPNGFHYILNSKDGIHLCGATDQGLSFVLTLETGIFFGIEKDKMMLGNEEFEEYLIALYLAGYIQFENDLLLEQAYKRYRAGYTLRWYGFTDRERFLYK
ncbi:pyruvate kinase, partial [Paenibacillus elgii]